MTGGKVQQQYRITGQKRKHVHNWRANGDTQTDIARRCILLLRYCAKDATRPSTTHSSSKALRNYPLQHGSHYAGRIFSDPHAVYRVRIHGRFVVAARGQRPNSTMACSSKPMAYKGEIPFVYVDADELLVFRRWIAVVNNYRIRCQYYYSILLTRK